MLKVVATFDVYVGEGMMQLMPDAASIGAAPSVTVEHAAPEVAPLPQYAKLVGAPVYVKVPSVLRTNPAGAAPDTLTP
jgi:hypothetical protein